MSFRDASWSRPYRKQQRPRIPPNLRGKEIGLYFKRRQTKLNKERVINLRIPHSVMNHVNLNLQSIARVAESLNINIEDIMNTDTSKVNYEDYVSSFETMKTQFKNDKTTSTDDTQDMKDKSNLTSGSTYIDTEPSTSSASDFIPMGEIKPEEINSGNQQLLLRGAGDYKYGYKDIITGSFDEKLDECISQGIKIQSLSEDIQKQSVNLYKEFEGMVTSKQYQQYLEFRKRLPTFKKSKELLEMLEANQVMVISGDTGCGKSTQVPQIILDNAIKNLKGANVKILVTQPRRIAAYSLAKRVAEERDEPLGHSVGYAIRLEIVDARPRASIMYCTTGMLLTELEVRQGLTNYSHIILDEVHERDFHVDLSMCILKRVLKKRKDLKLILMSATLESERLSAYFNDCPILHIKGLAYPVTDVYLEDILQLTNFTFKDDPPNINQRKPKWLKYRKGQVANEIEKNVKYRAEINEWLESKKADLDPPVYKTLQDSRIDELNIDLILELLIYLRQQEPGAILIFLPGISDITNLIRKMTESNCFPKSRFEIYPLHSKLHSLDQHKIFERPEEGKRKIIIATNIAETSITVDDIVYVIDCGKVKISGLNIEDNIATLQSEWISKANLRQRRGRAGRCQEGICYHMLTSYRATTLADQLLPELQRSNLLEPVLMIKKLRLGKALDAFKLVLDPPAETTIQWAVKHLQQAGALDANETLTPLGWHLARLPVHPAAGKLLLLGSLFGCLNRAASVAAVWGYKDPFNLIIGKERQVEEAKRNFALGEPSDHIALSEAIIQWEQIETYQGRSSFAYNNYLSNFTLQQLSSMKCQFGDNLRQMGFLPSGDIKALWENRNANNLSLFKAIIAAVLYPNIANVRWIGLNARNLCKPSRIVAHTPENGRVSLHPSSIMAMVKRKPVPISLCNKPGANWLVYWLKQRSSRLFLIDVTLVYTLPLLFFGELEFTKIEGEKTDDCIILISTIKVRCTKETARLISQLRSLLDQVLTSKIIIGHEQSRHNAFDEYVLNAVIELITAEDEQAEYLVDDDLSESDSSEQGSHAKRHH